MKLRLILTTKTKNNKDISIKFNIAPSKNLGFINFVKFVLRKGKSVEISFEKISKSGEREESKLFGEFQFQGKKGSEKILKDLEEEILELVKHKKKQKQKKKKKQ
ncbi:MAG: hypothetical protein ACFFBP_01660 [Promethearchaeota archaeon]